MLSSFYPLPSIFSLLLSLEFTTTLVMLYTHRLLLLRYSIPGHRETHPEDISINPEMSVLSSPDKLQPEFQVQETKNPVK